MASAFPQRQQQQQHAAGGGLSVLAERPQAEPAERAESAEQAESAAQIGGLAVELDGVTKRFGSKEVLRGIQLSIRPGEFVAVVGRSGCGKSTLLRLIAGLEEASGGTLARGGRPIRGIDADTRFMFQDARLLPWKTVLDNVMIGVTGAASAEARHRAQEALRLVGLEDRAGEWPSVLSGGQRQRVALARALVGSPRLLLFDEPLGALDALTRIEMQRLIEQLWTTRGFTAILVTHDVSEAVALADRVVLVEDGRITLDKRIELARPRAKDNSFSHYERVILERVLSPQTIVEPYEI